MKKNYLLLSIFLIAVFATLNVTKVNSKVAAPPAGSAGDPAFGTTCAQSGCHAGPDINATGTDVALFIGTGSPTTSLNSSFIYSPGTQYNIAFNILATAVGSNPYYGFQIIAEDAAGNTLGTMAINSGSTTTKAAGGYMGHKNANSTRNWAFKWTAPAAATGPVTFYYAFNIANSPVVPPTDPLGAVYKGSVTIQEGANGIEDISSKVSDLNIFPNPINQSFGVSFDLKEANQVSAQLYSVEGQLAKELINEKTNKGHIIRQFDLQELQAGIYLVKINVGEASITKRIVKQ